MSNVHQFEYFIMKFCFLADITQKRNVLFTMQMKGTLQMYFSFYNTTVYCYKLHYYKDLCDTYVKNNNKFL